MKKITTVFIVCFLIVTNLTYALPTTYRVQAGDVLWKIAADHKTTVKDLSELNHLRDPNLIYPNQLLKLSPKKEETPMTHAQKAVALIESLGTTNLEPVSYINPNTYIQHNLGVKDGLAGFAELVKVLPENTQAKNIRVFQDGDYVFMHNSYDFFGPKVGFDIFRFEDGLIVEHWDNLSPLAPDVNPAGRGQLDGTLVLKDLEKTDDNKRLVEHMIKDVFLGEAPEKITDYISTEKYFQHNTGVADGLNGLGAALEALAQAGTPMVYTKNHMVLGQGNFVLAVSEGQFLGDHVAFYDLFTIEDNKVVEHWDVIETIPPPRPVAKSKRQILSIKPGQ